MTIQIMPMSEADSDYLKVIDSGLNEYSQRVTGHERVPLNFIAKMGDVRVGGIKACTVENHFFISWLYVDDKYRAQGIGRDLMKHAEMMAKQKNCIKAFVDTMSFQAPEFYERLGFEEIVRITDFYQGYDRIFYSKMI